MSNRFSIGNMDENETYPIQEFKKSKKTKKINEPKITPIVKESKCIFFWPFNFFRKNELK